VPEAVSYIVEVSNTADFFNPQIRRQTSTASITGSALGEGSWFWRVMPVFPTVFSGSAVFSTASFFRIERIPPAPAETVEAGETSATVEASVTAETVSLSQWLATQAPSEELPPELPLEIIPPRLIKPPEPPPPEPLPPPRTPPPSRPLPSPRPQPIPLLPSPRNIQPATGTSFGLQDLRTQRSIVFNWSAVQGANAYIFTLYQQAAAGRRQIVRETINSGTSYTLTELRLLDRGTFVWQVEAVNIGRANAVEQRGAIGESTFIIDFPHSAPLQMDEGTGSLYGN
jgi:hypothetical protein